MASLKPWAPSSFSTIPGQVSRALTAFVALSSEENPEPFADRFVRPAGTTALSLIVMGLLLWMDRPRIGIGFLVLGAVVAFVVMLMMASSHRTQTVNSESRRKAVLARILGRLNRDRSQVGLDSIIPNPLLIGLEEVAKSWEHIEHALSSRQWRSNPESAVRIRRASTRTMENLLLFSFGNEAIHGLRKADVVTLTQMLPDLAQLVDAAGKVLDSYARPSGDSAEAPAPEVYPEIMALQQHLDEMESLLDL